MKPENREKMAKAIGMLEALAFVVKNPACDALDLAVDMLAKILEDEGGCDEGKKSDGNSFDF